MQINIFLKNIQKIRFLLEKSYDEKLSCKSIAEINKYLQINEKNRNFLSMISLIYELFFGFIIKSEQWDKFSSILQNYEKSNSEKRVVNQFMMGKGKSSVITPLLLLNLKKYNQPLHIIIPSHLVNQTKYQLYILNNLFNLNINIMTDTNAKLNVIKGNFDKNKGIFLFDEFDMMFDPIQSNFNIVTEKGHLFFEKTSRFDF